LKPQELNEILIFDEKNMQKTHPTKMGRPLMFWMSACCICCFEYVRNFMNKQINGTTLYINEYSGQQNSNQAARKEKEKK